MWAWAILATDEKQAPFAFALCRLPDRSKFEAVVYFRKITGGSMRVLQTCCGPVEVEGSDVAVIVTQRTQPDSTHIDQTPHSKLASCVKEALRVWVHLSRGLKNNW